MKINHREVDNQPYSYICSNETVGVDLNPLRMTLHKTMLMPNERIVLMPSLEFQREKSFSLGNLGDLALRLSLHIERIRIL